MSNMKDSLDKLYEPFDIREKPGGGGYKYAVAKDIVDRMNRTFEGCWSTEVVTREVIEDNIVVHVRVSVRDSDHLYYHDGFGSSQIARFTGGTNKGKAINLGNNFKSAKSIAIKDACAKWGAGLYLEDVDEEGSGGMPTEMPKNIPSPNPSAKAVDKPVETSQFPPFNVPSAPKKAVEAPVESPLPKVPSPAVSTPAAPPQAPPFAAPVSLTEDNTSASDSITDVQKIAIKSLLTLKKLEFGPLVAEALGRDDVPGKPEELNYQDAVTVIKYGNDIAKA